jgi:ATP-dependent Clp protease adaptor protein ClpS
MEKTITKKKTDTDKSNLYHLIIHNDNINSFDHVIECLIKYCGHESIQAEQCSITIHTKGKCDVKEGNFEEMYILKKKLENENLTCSIE